MKATRTKAEAAALDDIVQTLKRVPKARLNAVRAVVQALALPETVSNDQRKGKTQKKPSLLDTPFCGMWAEREDIMDERTYARQLRKMVESRGDRRTNLR
jgi:hypothetical protein